MKFNTDLARLALKEIENRPEEWNQENWRCGTGMCFAGFVAELAGARWATKNWRANAGYEVVAPDGERMTVAQFAARALGFDQKEYECGNAGMIDLFSALNTRENLRHLIDELDEVNR